jgi:exodeoxyribonuclease VII large subunit
VTAPPTQASGLVATDCPGQPTVGVAQLHQRIADVLSGAFPDRVWVCGEIVGTPTVRGGGVGIAFALAESQGATVVTVKAWLGRPYYQHLRQQLGDGAIAELLAAGNVVVVGGHLAYGGPFTSLELKVDRVVRTPAGAGLVAQELETARHELAVGGLLGQQRATTRLPLAPLRIGIVAGGAGTVGYHDAVTVLAHSGFRVHATHFPAPLEGATAPARIAAQVRNAAVGNQVVLVVRGGGAASQLTAFNSPQVATAIATAQVPVITGVGHSHHTTLADDAAWQACASPAHAAKIVADRLQASAEALERERAAIGRAARARLEALRVARKRRLGLGVALAALAALVIWQAGLRGVAVVLVAAVGVLAVRRRRVGVPALAPQPAAETFEDVVQELGAVEVALRTAATGADVQRLLQAADWLEHRGVELLGRTLTSNS